MAAESLTADELAERFELAVMEPDDNLVPNEACDLIGIVRRAVKLTECNRADGETIELLHHIERYAKRQCFSVPTVSEALKVLERARIHVGAVDDRGIHLRRLQ